MQPRTKREIEVTALSAKLPTLTQGQREWAEKKSTGTAHVNKKYAWCSECGNHLPKSILSNISKGELVCPHCGKKLNLRERSLGVIHYDIFYFSIMTTCKGYQLFRTFIVSKKEQRNLKAEFSIIEVLQNWLDSEGKETIIARNSVMMGGQYQYDRWNIYSDMSIKHRGHYSSYYGDERYHINPHYVYKVRKSIPTLTKKGYKGIFLDMNPLVIALNILTNNNYEYLVKTNQLSVFKYLSYSCHEDIPFKHAVNICNRNNYIIEDASLWYDMLRAFEYLGKDTHNNKYICPTNLKQSHDMAIALKRKKEDKERAREEALNALQWEEKYQKAKEKFFDLEISNENFSIKVLRSVADFYEEGKKMHHCVYACGYYKRDNCLILSARNNDGERVETIEINLDSYCIIQSRGVCNTQTKFHDEILKLVNENMYKIKNIRKGKETQPGRNNVAA